MNTVAHTARDTTGKLIWTCSGIMVFASLSFFLLSFSEFYQVALGGSASTYPWGSTHQYPWYYSTPATYSGYQLIAGLLFLGAAILTLRAMVMKDKPLVIKGITITALFLAAEIISINIRH